MKLYQQTQGHGPDLVLLHGWGMHGGVLQTLAEHCADRYRVHRIDLPGHGRSRDGAPDFTLEQVSNQISSQIPPGSTLLGWSLGGLIAQTIALQAPQRVARLLLVCSSPQFYQNSQWPHGMAPPLLAGFGADLARDYEATVLRFLALCAQGSPAMREDLRQLKTLIFAPGVPHPQALRSGLNLLQQTSLLGLLPLLSQPTHFIMGEHDRIVPPQAGAAAALLPQGHSHVIAKASHLPFVSHPAEFFAVLDRCLA